MKTFLAISLLLLTLAGCSDHSSEPYDADPPFAPVGIRTTSLDKAVEIRWIANQESDLDGYHVYVSNTYSGRYTHIGTTRTTTFLDKGARNGFTYYYAVSAFDFTGNESPLSKDVVYDTPRPEGLDVPLKDRFRDPFRSGYDFSEYRVGYYDSDNTDFFYEATAQGTPILFVWDDTDIQDMGYTSSLDEISVAPEKGWSPTKSATAIEGHTYVIWTFDNHFAKVRITDILSDAIVFDWAYQTAVGNPELFRRGGQSLSKQGRMRNRR